MTTDVLYSNVRISSSVRTISEFSGVNCASGGGEIEPIRIPLHHAIATFPESRLEGVIVLGDLQCYDRKDVPEEDRCLMSYIVADELAALSGAGLIPASDKLGVIIVGDLYAEPCLLKRGGSGDVDMIWKTFADRFRWVVGVAGNHDLFEGKDEFPNHFHSQSNIHPLDGDSVKLDGIKFGGISGIIGNPRKTWRYDETDFLQKSHKLLEERPDWVIFHQGPVGSKKGMRGSNFINEIWIHRSHTPEIITFGHCHWPVPLDQQNSCDLINSDCRVILLTKETTTLGI